MSDDTAPIVVTLKAGTDFAAPWLVIRGYDPEDVTLKLRNLDGVIEATLEAAGLFTAQRSLGPAAAAPQSAPAQQAPKPAWGSNSGQAGMNIVPQQRQPGGNHPSAQLHPEGKGCAVCGTTLEFKKSQGGKAKWQCPQWRWNNGNPNDHTVEWAN